MLRFVIASALWMLSSVQVIGHEMTPTYPELRPSYVDGLSVVSMNLFNRREDVSYYEIQVFDEDWRPVLFASQDKIIELEYLGKKDFDIYIRDKDQNRVEYICTMSKLLKDNLRNSGVASKICSKIKRD